MTHMNSRFRSRVYDSIHRRT